MSGGSISARLWGHPTYRIPYLHPLADAPALAHEHCSGHAPAPTQAHGMFLALALLRLLPPTAQSHNALTPPYLLDNLHLIHFQYLHLSTHIHEPNDHLLYTRTNFFFPLLSRLPYSPTASTSLHSDLIPTFLVSTSFSRLSPGSCLPSPDHLAFIQSLIKIDVSRLHSALLATRKTPRKHYKCKQS